MNISFWIANKMSGKSNGDKISKPVVNIAIAGVAVGIALIIVSLCIVKGFQKEIRDKVVGFGAHIQVLSNEQNQSRETPAVRLDQPFYPGIDSLESIANVQHFAVKPGILETKQNLQGVLIKGLGQGYDWKFFADKLVEGSALELSDSARSKQMVVSSSIANRLELELEDKVTLYLVIDEGNIRPRNFVVSGIYNTGLKEFDDQFVFIDIGHIQKINQWGVEAQIKVIEEDGIQIEGLGFGGKGKQSFEWNNGWEGPGPHDLNLTSDSTIQMVFSNGMSLPDTAWVKFELATENDEGSEYVLSRWTSGGSHKFYTGGFEITVTNFEDIDEVRRSLINQGVIPYYLQVRTVKEQNREIFSWLNMLDLNVDLIIGLMVLIAIVNMTSALLIIILERVGMIGLLKTMGMTSGSIVRIFIIHASRIISKGFIIGNLLGFGFALLQWKFGIVSLDPEFYYLSQVPIHFSWELLYVQILCLVTCFAFMIFPALYVGTIQPAKAIRFD